MKKMLVVVLALMTQTVNAGTVYKNRYIPGGVCMVTLSTATTQATINASLIAQIYAGELSKRVRTNDNSYKFNPNDYYKTVNFYGVKVYLVNGSSYTFEVNSYSNDDAQEKKEQFLKIIKDTCQN